MLLSVQAMAFITAILAGLNRKTGWSSWSIVVRKPKKGGDASLGYNPLSPTMIDIIIYIIISIIKRGELKSGIF